jgi:23S rRNA (uracil1939-C5)-methyltransferase
MEKNDIFAIKIEDMSDDGMGIGHIDGMAVFVKDTAPGDEAEIKIVKVKKSYAFGRLRQILKPSPYRIDPVCPVARQCGGCIIQHMDYSAQLDMKKNRVINCLKRIGKVENAEELCEGIL